MNQGIPPDPYTILRTLGKTYAQCATYRDHGLVETKFHTGMPTEMTSKTWFTTYFKRPDLFDLHFSREPYGVLRHARIPACHLDRNETLSVQT